MAIEEIINTLEAERDNLTRAIEALRGSRSGRKAGGPWGGGRRRLSASARKKISDAMRRTWAARKKKEKVA